jgi:tetratricopeptide (TPR) repeat protein
MEEALKELGAAVQLDHKLKIAHYSYGVALEAKGKLPEAVNEYNLALKLDRYDKNAQAAIELGGPPYPFTLPHHTVDPSRFLRRVGFHNVPRTLSNLHGRVGPPFPLILVTHKCRGRRAVNNGR